MKKLFNEYLKYEPETVKKIWENAIISFDTNVLLDLYRLAPKSSNDMLSVMESLSENVWLTYQVGCEFFKNRVETFLYVDDVSKSLSTIYQNIEKLSEQREMKEGYKANALIGKSVIQAKTLIKDINETYEKHFEELRNNDTTLQRLLTLFDGKTEEPFSKEALEKIFIEGEKRYKEEIPPGYKDEKNKKELPKQILYGDLIIWKSLINKAKQEDKNLIFVTNDQKSDWILEVHGRKNGPRPELVREFQKETGRSLLIYNSQSFLDYAKKNLSKKPTETTIRDVKTINKQEDDMVKKLDNSFIESYLDMLKSENKIIKPSEVSNYLSSLQNTMKVVDSITKINQLTEQLRWYEKYFQGIYGTKEKKMIKG